MLLVDEEGPGRHLSREGVKTYKFVGNVSVMT